MHVALLGDSVFDNRNYTGGAPDVATHLRGLLPAEAHVSLLAKDGATTGDAAPQLEQVTRDVTHLVLSLGGNDALMSLDVLRMEVENAAHGFLLLGQRVRRFEAAYREIVEHLLTLDRPLLLCTVYNGAFGGDFELIARTALAAFNDVIIRVAFEHNLQLLDLRSVCTEPADYVLEIEPSEQGGGRIAACIAQALTGPRMRTGLGPS